MADTFSHTSKLQRQDSSNHSNPSKFSYNYMYKAALVTICLLLLPFVPSQPPEFINQTLHARSWELLQLIFVGIAVSYGLFSKKNDGTDKDHVSKFDNAQTYVSKLLQVSSVFDDDTENQTVVDDNKVQTWNSQYYREEPLKVVAEESPIRVKEQTAASSGVGQKPLLLPVRSLKQRVPETVEVDDSNGKTGSLISRSRSNSGSKRFTSSSSKNSRNDELGEINPVNLEEKVEDCVVLRSPIPWRSRSGRMQMKENGDDPPSYSMEDLEFDSLESPSLRSSRPNSTSSTPKTLSPSPSISSPKKLSSLSSIESQAKTCENLMRRKNSDNFSPPPPPPPPPPPTHLRKSVLMKSNSSVLNDTVCSEKQMKRSIRSVPTQELSKTELDELPRRADFGSDFKATRVGSDDVPFVGKSVRTIRGGEFQTQEYEAYTNKSMHENVIPNKASSKKEPINEKVTVETIDDDYSSETEFEDDYFEGSSSGNNGEPRSMNMDDNGNDVGRDVDKKADEFIAKFREQIRLQRIESIRRSTKQRAAANTSR